MSRALAAGAALAVVLAGCGDSAGGDAKPQLTVSAASSLRDALTTYGDSFKGATVRLSFGGSDDLAAQIRAGARPDLYAAANTKLPAALHAEGLAEAPVAFASNRLVIAVPASDAEIGSVHDLVAPGRSVAIGAESVPIGSYTREVLAKLGSIERNRILANVKTEEPDVAGIIGKLTQGAANAGFVYATDVIASRGKLRAVRLPPRLRPVVQYDAAVVKGAKNLAAARRFLAGLRTGAGRQALRRAGFAPPPR